MRKQQGSAQQATQRDESHAGAPQAAHDDIAVIGMACRFPGAADYHEFWRNLRDGVFSVTEVPADRWSKEAYYSPRRTDENKTVSKWGGFIDDVDKFDAPLFKISPREAEMMDPQQRIALELAWSCIEDAGYAPSDLRGGDIGVYIGVANYDYKSLVERLPLIEAHISTGVHTSLVPNRISFEFDFKGPSVAIDTACSSSLVALDEAVHAMRRGDCVAALVGGVSVLCSPTHFVSFSKTGMLAPDGVCRTFDARADGYVRGEGAGLILLKPLQQALRDGDAIHGLIKGVGVSHGGRAQTITSPNPFAQSQAIMKAFRNARVSPASVNYIEAHGTGTPKGDPIEINALVRAYSSLARQGDIVLSERSCGIGSVKTNIGHLEPSAGIAGVIKVLLAMKHRTLPPLLHFTSLNPRVKLDSSPFYLVTQTQAWQIGRDGVRRAGVSSFGFGGVNAHVLLEDYDTDSDETKAAIGRAQSTSHLFVFSAKTPESLKNYVASVLAYIGENQDGVRPAPMERPFSIESLAYSLHRRESMDERLAVEASTVEELAGKLAAFLRDQPVEACWKGNAKDAAEAKPADEKPTPEALNDWLIQRRLPEIASHWVRGTAVVDWSACYAQIGGLPAKIRLPHYRFARKRYWFDTAVEQSSAVSPPRLEAVAGAGFLHPLVHRNTSTFAEQRFSSTFTGEEFFLRDHCVNGGKILPGVAYLEMIHTALRHSCEAQASEPHRVELKQIVWSSPIIAGESPVEAHIALHPEGGDGGAGQVYSFEVYSGHRQTRAATHCRGRARLLPAESASELELPQLQARFAAGTRRVEDYYNAFDAMGIRYGAGHRAIDGLSTTHASDGCPEVLARVVVPTAVASTRSHYALHPGLLDAALQATLALGWQAGDAIPSAPFVPFAIDSIEVAADMAESAPEAMWAWVRPVRNRWLADSPVTFVQRMSVPCDIDLCDAQGRILVSIRGFSTRAMRGDARQAGAEDAQGLIMLAPTWNEHPIDRAPSQVDPSFSDHSILFAGFGGDDAIDARTAAAALREHASRMQAGPRIDVLEAGGSGSPAGRFEQTAVALFERIQSMLPDAAAGGRLLQIVVPAEGRNAGFIGLSGLLRTARLEQPKWVVQLMVIDPALPADRLWTRLCEGSLHPGVVVFRHRLEQAWAAGLTELEPSAIPQTPSAVTQGPWKATGVYLVTGGAGGLGRLFAAEICTKVERPTVVLTGRSELDAAALAELRRMGRNGASIEYQRLDVGDGAAVSRLVQDIVRRHGALNGVIHCAGILRDNYIARKTPGEFRQVLAPKVEGTLHLHEATRGIELDFFALFSSTASALGNIGQADYATANAFMDAFANHCQQSNDAADVTSGRGHVVSINWPLWQAGGMSIDDATARMLKERYGLVALDTASGIQAFYTAMACGKSQVVVLNGVLPTLRRRFLDTQEHKVSPVQAAVQASVQPAVQPRKPVQVPPGDAVEKLKRALLQTAAGLLKLDAADIDTRTELSEYGFDSIAYTGLAGQISELYGIDVSPTLFFDYPTIDGIAGYLLDAHRDSVCKTATAVEAEPEAKDSVPSDASPVDLETGSRAIADEPLRTSPLRLAPRAMAGDAPVASAAATVHVPPATAATTTARDDVVAIVGISGCFPMARDPDAFWDNLIQGKHCIREVPGQRWDWQAIYGDPTTDPNRSNVKWGGFIDGVDEFDPLFFGISPREATLMDPQQRLLMTHVWKAIEEAGYSPSSLSGSRTGVFVGTASVGYASLLAKSGLPIEGYTSTATVPSIGPNRVSFLLNLHGPSEPIETACSSSLVAIHRAMVAMQVGDCDQAIVGGVNTIVTPDLHISFNKAGMLALDGRCKTFSSDANGYVRGEGVGVLFLKKLKAAEDAGDHIHGLLIGSAENHGGRANSLTSPNSRSQADVLVRAHRKAGIDPRTVTYLEAHGTGTSLGDPVEINGIKTAFKTLYEDMPDSPIGGHRCALASVKTNIGHLELAAGVAGVVKVLLQFRHRQIAPSLHCDELNPLIELGDTPFHVATRSEPWTAIHDAQGRELPRRAGVSSFGFGGVNAHVVLEEYVPGARPARGPASLPSLVPISARNAAVLRDYVADVVAFIARSPEVSLSDLAYTLQVGRDAMDERLAVVAHDLDDLARKLQGFLDGRTDLDDVYVNQVARNRDALGEFAGDEDLQSTMETWHSKAKYGKLLGMWVKGVSFDWSALHRQQPADQAPRRISAPTYPFARERLWVKPAAGSTTGAVVQVPPPTSSLQEPVVAAAAAVVAVDPVLVALRALRNGSMDIEHAISAVAKEPEPAGG